MAIPRRVGDRLSIDEHVDAPRDSAPTLLERDHCAHTAHDVKDRSPENVVINPKLRTSR